MCKKTWRKIFTTWNLNRPKYLVSLHPFLILFQTNDQKQKRSPFSSKYWPMARLRAHTNDDPNYRHRLMKADPNVTGNCQFRVKFCKREQHYIAMYIKVFSPCLWRVRSLMYLSFNYMSLYLRYNYTHSRQLSGILKQQVPQCIKLSDTNYYLDTTMSVTRCGRHHGKDMNTWLLHTVKTTR